jgi:hypothetical protein
MKPKQRNREKREVYSVKWVELSFVERLKMYAQSIWASVRFFPDKKYPHISCENAR